MKNLIIIILLLFVSACAELNLANHLTKKIIMNNKDQNETREKLIYALNVINKISSIKKANYGVLQV